MPVNLKPNGKGHSVLRLLNRGPADPAQIRAEVGRDWSASERRKLFFVFEALLQEGFALQFRGVMEITRHGEAELVRLEEIAPEYSIRIFERRVA